MNRPLAVLVSAAAASTSTRSSLGLKLIFAIMIIEILVKQLLLRPCDNSAMVNFRQFRYRFAGKGSKDGEKCQTDRVEFKRNWQFDRVFRTGFDITPVLENGLIKRFYNKSAFASRFWQVSRCSAGQYFTTRFWNNLIQNIHALFHGEIARCDK